MEKIVRILISLVVLGIALAGIVFLVWPSYLKFSDLRMQVQAARDRLAQGEEALIKLKALQARVAEHEEDFTKIAEAVPQDVALPALYNHIQQLAASSGLVLNSITGKEAKEQEQELSLLVIHTDLAGSYQGVKQFLNATQRSARFLNVRSLSISSSQDADTLTITLELVAYAKP